MAIINDNMRHRQHEATCAACVHLRRAKKQRYRVGRERGRGEGEMQGRAEPKNERQLGDVARFAQMKRHESDTRQGGKRQA